MIVIFFASTSFYKKNALAFLAKSGCKIFNDCFEKANGKFIMNAMEVAMRMLETGNNKQTIKSDLVLSSEQAQMSESEQTQINQSGHNQTSMDLTQIRFNPNSLASKNSVNLALSKVVELFYN